MQLNSASCTTSARTALILHALIIQAGGKQAEGGGARGGIIHHSTTHPAAQPDSQAVGCSLAVAGLSLPAHMDGGMLAPQWVHAAGWSPQHPRPPSLKGPPIAQVDRTRL